MVIEPLFGQWMNAVLSMEQLQNSLYDIVWQGTILVLCYVWIMDELNIVSSLALHLILGQ